MVREQGKLQLKHVQLAVVMKVIIKKNIQCGIMQQLVAIFKMNKSDFKETESNVVKWKSRWLMLKDYQENNFVEATRWADYSNSTHVVAT